MTPVVGKWLKIDVDGQIYLVYGYLDREAGWSAKGVQVAGAQPTPDECATAMQRPAVTLRLPMGMITALPEGEAPAYGLSEPSWMQFFASEDEDQDQLAWRSDARLSLHADYPDDLQAQFFFFEAGAVEQIWVRLVAQVTGGYAGTLLNQPHARGPNQGDRVVIRPTPGSVMPVWVSPAVEDNLRRYHGSCQQCGFDLVVTPIDQLVRAQFPDAPEGAQLMQFTTRCALCRGTQVLEAR